VLTGVTGPAEAVLAPPHQRPTYLAEDLSGLVEPQPAPRSEDGAFGCGGWTARWADDGSELELSGPRSRIDDQRSRIDGQRSRIDGQRSRIDGRRTRIDGLRALCAAAWSRDDVTAAHITRALQTLERSDQTAHEHDR
jgi:hypothetical protein